MTPSAVGERHYTCRYKQLLLVSCLMPRQHASVSQGRICSDKITCCHTETEVADPTFRLTQSQYTHTGPTSPSADPIPPGAWQGSHWSANFEVTGMTRPRKNPGASGIRTPGSSALGANVLTTRPTRRSRREKSKPSNRKHNNTSSFEKWLCFSPLTEQSHAPQTEAGNLTKLPETVENANEEG